ncbi:TetR/AcrR family transcriptional regulator [Streptomyces coffeae]|uniref:TetR/AcrR family transcriptional regulator C-terminal domain-containing protein n=1 Tax=Streptomyces coffeae TaxID=621382 RepID=A0ABS1NH72_9ACTN|nr:TetR family transcriptional regulator [Streptomyces coffeae]MBL1099439.1 TetR/AcrR family transcriptional regulator C-terminal domain-containing protein [Streptomyces coffeae]
MTGAADERIPHQRRRRRPTRSGTLLSAELIVDCALRLIGEHGPEALSVRRLGAALGCDPSAVYRYFRNTDDLLLAVADRIIGDSMAGFVPGSDWVDSLREMARRVRDGYLAHPRAAALASYRVTRRENEFHSVETGVGILLRAGFAPARALRLYLAFVDTVLGHAALDAATLALPAAQRETDGWASTLAYRSVDADVYPVLASVRDDLDILAESSFEDALELVLAALVAQAPRGAPGTE